VKLLFVGDIHLRGKNPRNRIDNYQETIREKLCEVYEIAKQHQVRAILCPGDIFDWPEVSNGVLIKCMQLLRECPVAIYTCPGNHDIYGYNLDTYDRTSLRLLSELVPRLHVVRDPGSPVLFSAIGVDVAVTFTPYSGRMDHGGYGYSPEYRHRDTRLHIHVAHGMLLDHTPPFDRFTLIQDVKTEADIVLSGHDHTGFGVYHRADGKIFCNPGSLTRMSASVNEIERTVQVALIDTDTKNIELIPLKCAKLGDEVLDRSKIEADQKRQYAMEEFAALIQTGSGERVLLNIDDIVTTIAAQEQLPRDVVEATLKKIEEQRMCS
jgi:exonuclease SbcD